MKKQPKPEYKVNAFYWCKLKPGFNERGHNKEPYWTIVQYMMEDDDFGHTFRCMDTRFPITDADYEEIGQEIKPTPA